MTVIVKDEDGELVPLTGAEIRFSVKAKIDDADYTFQRSNSGAGGNDTEIKIIADGEYEVYLVSANTQNITPRSYKYDSEVILPDGNNKTPVWGKLTIKADVTRPAS